MTEYAIAAALIGLLSIGGLAALRGATNTSFTNMANGLSNPVSHATLVPATPTPVINPAINTAPPTNAGSAKVNWTMYASTGTWTSSAPISPYAYQWQDCNISGSSCTPIAGASAASYVVQASDLGQYVNVKVTANNGAVTPGTASSAPSVAVTPRNATRGPAGSAQFAKDSSGIVHLTGVIQNNSAATSPTLIGTLPVGDRPAGEVTVTALSDDGVTSQHGVVRLVIRSDGTILRDIVMTTPTGSWTGNALGFLSLSNISFPAQGASGYTPLSYNSGWADYKVLSPGYEPSGYLVDGDGMVHLSGLVRYTGAHFTENTASAVIAVLPQNARPLERAIGRAVQYSGAFLYSRVDISTDGSVIIMGDAFGTTMGNTDSWISLDNIVYPSSANTLSWASLPLINGWATYGAGYQQPQYAAAPDGIVSVKGLIVQNGGTYVGSSPLTSGLPAAVSPAALELTDVLASNFATGAYQAARIDMHVSNDGTYPSQVSDVFQIPGPFGSLSSWLALSTLSWVLLTSNLPWAPLQFATGNGNWSNY